MKHQLMVPGVDCYCKGNHDISCPVCEWGACICVNCGMAECDLLDYPECKGTKAKPRKKRPRKRSKE